MNGHYPISNDVIKSLTAVEPGGAVWDALQTLLEQDADLLRLDANERSITHRFAMYLQALLPDWHVDCEYNRDGHDPKRVALPTLHPLDDDADAQTVFPDVIVHHRGTDKNYLVIEFKKLGGRFSDHTDLEKLAAYKADLQPTRLPTLRSSDAS